MILSSEVRRAVGQVFAAWLGLAVLGCDGEPPPTAPPAPTEAPKPQTPDRLPPGELLEGTERAFLFPIPKTMRLDAVFSDSAFAIGEVEAAALLQYVKDHVVAKHVEMVPGRTIFPTAKVRGGDGRLLHIEIATNDDKSTLVLRDITPPASTPGLTQEQRWEKAGMTSTGQLIDPKNLQ